MALKVNGSIIGYYHPVIETGLMMTNSEAAVEGRGYCLTSGRWTKAATTAALEAICIKSSDAGTDVPAVMEIVKTGDIIEADYTGTPDVAFTPGLSVGVLDANGDNVDAATVTGGHLKIVGQDSSRKKVRLVAMKNYTAN